MHLTHRQQKIIAVLQKNGHVTVEELSRILFFSPSTIRRELEILQQHELIHRTHGGAALRNSWSEGVPALIREAQEANAKLKIAEAAARHIQDGDHVFIDSSSTALFIADYLKERTNLTVFTNGLQLTNRLLHFPKIKTICTGGQLVTTSYSFVGSHTQHFLEYYFADKLFFSSNSFSLFHGVTDNSEKETELKRQMVQNCRQAYYLADASKIGCSSTYKVCNAAALYMLITNAGPELFSSEKSLPFQICHVSSD